MLNQTKYDILVSSLGHHKTKNHHSTMSKSSILSKNDCFPWNRLCKTSLADNTHIPAITFSVTSMISELHSQHSIAQFPLAKLLTSLCNPTPLGLMRELLESCFWRRKRRNLSNACLHCQASISKTIKSKMYFLFCWNLSMASN